MSASTLGFVGGVGTANRHHLRAGYTRISSGAMHQLVAAIAAEAFNVPLREVNAKLHDEKGQVSVSLAVPLVLPLDNVGERFGKGGGTVFELADAAKDVMAARIQTLAGTNVGRVNVRLTGIHDGKNVSSRRVQ
ncbi:hypothetical protein [Arthrobacter sp. E3]|uniref:hypothetical protein n=1 Tax=Arthrobacter sp. E3 TaxID=517402 RepID=UPI001A93B35B|nr:hypothetical protein [Arthrobacter sp. E3]